MAGPLLPGMEAVRMRGPEPCPFCGNGSPGTGWRVRYEPEPDGMEDLRLKGRVHAGVWCSCGASVEVRMEPDDVYHDIQCIATGLWNRRAVG